MAKLICIQARRDGFRRAGISHPAETVEHAYDCFTPAQIEQLLAEPQLMVTVVDRPDPGSNQTPPNQTSAAKRERPAAETERKDGK